jgi:hypothetical protein
LTWINAAGRAFGEIAIMFSHPLAREVAVIVAIKTAIIVAAALFVFGAVHVTPRSTEAHVFHSDLETDR